MGSVWRVVVSELRGQMMVVWVGVGSSRVRWRNEET